MVSKAVSNWFIFSDDAHLRTNGYLQKKIIEFKTPMNLKKSQCLCGPYFFENDVDRAITVTDEQYKSMIY